jgi:O-antigen/teichoic acid export membrane protein
MTATAEQGREPESGRARADLRRLARGSALNVAGSSAAVALNLVLPILITRNLTKDDAGLFFQATALFAIMLNTATLGADTGVLRSFPRAIALSRRRDLARYLALAVVPAFLFSLVLTATLLLLAGPLARLITDDAAQAAQSRTVLLVLLPWVPVAVVYAVTMSASRGLGSVVPLVVVEKLGRNALETGAAGVAATLTTSVALIVTAWVAPYVAVLAVAAVWVLRRLRTTAASGAADPPAAPWRELGPEFWRFSAPRAVSRLFTIALQQFDILIVGALRGPADAAVYAAATRFLILGLMFVQAIQQVMAPEISECLALDDDRRAERIYRTTTAWLTLVSWPIYLGAMLYAPLLLGIFGPGYDRGAVAVVVLCGAMLVATACGPVDSMLLMAGRSVLSLINTGVALALNVGLDLVLVPELGVSGAALGWAVSILVKNVLALWQVNRSHAMHPFGPGTLSAMTICLVSFGGVAGAVRVSLGSGLPSFLLAGALGAASFVVLARRRSTDLDLPALASVLRRSQRR